MDKLNYSATELAAKIQSGECSVVEVATAYLNQIAKSDDTIGAWLLVDRDKVIAQASEVQREIDRRKASGEAIPSLAGVPVGIKDNICTEGMKTTCASHMLESFVPPYDATVVRKIKDNLMVILGKLNMDEFAMGSSTEHSAYKQTKNPWNTDCVPGGSSGGSTAAVAAMQAPLTLGSDTGGSIRQPAAFCGVTGLKPTYGTVSRYGLVAFASSLDQIGPVAKDAKGCAALFDVICGYDNHDSTSLNREYTSCLDSIEDFNKPVIGIPEQYLGEGINSEVKLAVKMAANAYKNIGCEVKTVSIPTLEYALPAYYILSSAEASSNLSRFDGVRYGYRSENIKDLEDLYTKTRSEGFGMEVKRRIMLGAYALCSGYYDEYYNKALKARSLVKQGFDKAFVSCDLLLTPTTPTSAFKFGAHADAVSMYMADICTVAINIAGLPALSMPAGFDAEGMPIGVQLIGDLNSESLLLSSAHAFQQRTDYHRQVAGGAK